MEALGVVAPVAAGARESLAIRARCKALPVLNCSDPASVLGYDDQGLLYRRFGRGNRSGGMGFVDPFAFAQVSGEPIMAVEGGHAENRR